LPKGGPYKPSFGLCVAVLTCCSTQNPKFKAIRDTKALIPHTGTKQSKVGTPRNRFWVEQRFSAALTCPKMIGFSR